MSDLVTIDINSNGVADVRLNRPDKYNALSSEMFDAISEAGESLIDNKTLRAVVLSGNGRGFCAGLDFSGFKNMAGESEPQAVAGRRMSSSNIPGNPAQRPGMVWKEVPVPVIAAIHGVAYGGGFQIAMGADIRIAAPDAKFSVMEIKWGLIPDCSITQTLRDLVRLDIAKELTFTGRILPATEAAELGLVTSINDSPLEAALGMAETIASKSPNAIRLGKHLFENTWRTDVDRGLKLEAQLQGRLIGSSNQVEAVKANFEERSPQFSDPD
ncbi:MAG TPA: crotonase/enoyl-CoA hydratase family protein [Pseudomonadales bacterium]|jgi:enoyl-CoA hydratase/carnithine racemase|nr:enoyl-CoA hydratase [Gammaproteobacteria bacterium]MDP6026262.1 crotonase/enoyl-CoA hydratase family protein [Pseudomonadales bacterium]MDP7314103.1 crotonase/enoyl-CoA hydratase family protein [Pseudomonadales bacterium]MDP7451326.1 crotonase/enoyl-CoA hydratase family protein [Arenicellales bacterium]HJP50188.1 crotonase/enoyl-CoA hydratase family protein [Pseudomonadales bacterium]|tara:strand:- start:955 stop:1767 length:813 start_codon:yes stop_codon:yes gene_type:complete